MHLKDEPPIVVLCIHPVLDFKTLAEYSLGPGRGRLDRRAHHSLLQASQLVVEQLGAR